MDLGAEHDCGEGEEQEALKAQEDQQDYSYGRREVAALCPLPSDAGDELKPTENQSMNRRQSYVHGEKHEEPLILLPDAVVHPRAVMVHLSNASLANTAVVGTFRLDAATLGALVDHLAWLQLQALHVLLRGVAFGDSTRVSEHGSQVGGQREHRQAVEEDSVHHGVPEVFGRQQHDKGHHEVCIDDEKPRHDSTDHATAISDEPHPVCHVSLGGRRGC